MPDKMSPEDPEPASGSASFEALIEPHLKVLWQTAYRFTGHRQDSEDLLQDLLARLYPQRARLAAVEDLRPWLIRSLHNLFVDRKRSWFRNVLSRGDSDDARLEAIEAETPGPESAAQAEDVRQALFAALAQLDHSQRAVIVLHDMQGHTLAELQAMLEVPLGTLKSRLFRGRARLRELLGGNHSPASVVVMDERTEP
jgi:RNA polymerase sigma-70 factor (ECF subfamily)